MAQRDGKSELQVVHLGNLALSGDTPAASAWVDARDFDKVTLAVVANTVTDAGDASGIVFEVQESATTAAADATAVANDQLIGSESDLTITLDTDDNVIAGGIGYIGTKRYVRIVATGSTGTDADVSIVAITGDASYEPRAFVGASVAAT